jgi:hypothetical protein
MTTPKGPPFLSQLQLDPRTVRKNLSPSTQAKHICLATMKVKGYTSAKQSYLSPDHTRSNLSNSSMTRSVCLLQQPNRLDPPRKHPSQVGLCSFTQRMIQPPIQKLISLFRGQTRRHAARLTRRHHFHTLLASIPRSLFCPIVGEDGPISPSLTSRRLDSVAVLLHGFSWEAV